ncbi:MAG TPA: hypothetical protein VF914_05510 [Chloroflexia bacterium]
MDEPTRAIYTQLGHVAGTQEQILAIMGRLENKVDQVIASGNGTETRVAQLEFQMGFLKRFGAPIVLLGSMLGRLVGGWLGIPG